MRLRARTSTADSETSSSAPYGSIRQRQQSGRHRRGVEEEEESTEPVDAMTMSRMVALVAQQGGEVDRTLEQVLEAKTVTKALLRRCVTLCTSE